MWGALGTMWGVLRLMLGATGVMLGATGLMRGALRTIWGAPGVMWGALGVMWVPCVPLPVGAHPGFWGTCSFWGSPSSSSAPGSSSRPSLPNSSSSSCSSSSSTRPSAAAQALGCWRGSPIASRAPSLPACYEGASSGLSTKALVCQGLGAPRTPTTACCSLTLSPARESKGEVGGGSTQSAPLHPQPHCPHPGVPAPVLLTLLTQVLQDLLGRLCGERVGIQRG